MLRASRVCDVHAQATPIHGITAIGVLLYKKRQTKKNKTENQFTADRGVWADKVTLYKTRRSISSPFDQDAIP